MVIYFGGVVLIYDRVNLRLHPGTKSIWSEAARSRELSLSAFVSLAVSYYLLVNDPGALLVPLLEEVRDLCSSLPSSDLSPSPPDPV